MTHSILVSGIQHSDLIFKKKTGTWIFFFLVGVLVSLGFCNNVPQTGWLEQQKFVSHSLEAGKSQTGCQHGQVGESSSGLQAAGPRGRRAGGGSTLSHDSANPIHESPSCSPKYLAKAILLEDVIPTK